MTAAQVTVVVNQKGGVGKTETTVNVGGALAELGRRVLLVDLDPSGSLTDALKVTVPDDAVPLAAALTHPGKRTPRPHTVRHSTTAAGGFLDVLPATAHMVGIVHDLYKMRAREHRLTTALGTLADEYDHILVDCPPTLDLLTDNALVAAHGTLIPVQAEDSTLLALRLLLTQIAEVDEDLRDEPLVLHGLVVSLLRRPPSQIARSVLDDLEGLPDVPILGTVPAGVAVSKAHRLARTVVDYAPASEHADVYRRLAGVLEATR